MLKKRTFVRSKIAMSVSLALAASLSVANAQTELEEVVVIGIKGSLKRAQSIKMQSSSVVEALSAEDIGKLPDSSIAESLARLPGLAGERRNGRTSGISVRGLREDFVGTTLNGRELLGIGDNRGVDYDLYPSEIMSGAVVYKSPNGALTTTGIGGTVDLLTKRPLDDPGAERTLTLNGTLELNDIDAQNPDYDDTGHRYALSYSDDFNEGKVGLALTYAQTASPNQTQFNRISRYTSGDFKSGPYEGFDTVRSITVANISRELERDTLAGVLQFAPTEDLTISLDYLNIDFSESGIKRGYNSSIPNASDGSNVLSASNGVVTSAFTLPYQDVVRADTIDKVGELNAYGLNFAYELNDDWRINVDLSTSDTKKVDQRAESYAGVGRAGSATQGAPGTITWRSTDEGLQYSNSSNADVLSDYDAITLAGPQSWGGGLASINELQNTGVQGVGFSQAQDGFDNTAFFDEELDNIRLESEVDLEGSFFEVINFGVSHTERSKSKLNQGFFLTASTFPFDDAVPQGFRRGVTDVSWAGIPSLVAYDAQGLIDSGFYTRYDANSLEPDRLGDSYTVFEEISTAFVKADFRTELGGATVFGNIGLQAVSTDQSTSRFNTITGADFRVVATPDEEGASYSNVLPSLNLNADFGNGHMARFTASKVISRPRIDELGAGDSIRFNNSTDDVQALTAEDGPWKSSKGNAVLEPYEANQFDLAYEWYFSDAGYLSATYFYKDLVNWHRSVTEVRDFSPFYIPGFHQAVSSNGEIFTPGTFLGLDTSTEDGVTGSVDGLELQLSLPIGDYIGALEGLGVVFSAAFSDGSLDVEENDNNEDRVPGLSDDVYQATIFYQTGGFEFRIAGTKRSDFLSEQAGVSNSLSPVLRSGNELVDAQISYDFANSSNPALQGLRISLQGQNLTDENDVLFDSDGRVLISERYGRNFLLNFNYSF